MEIQNTQKDYDDVASIVMCVYGPGGVGKTTFASTFPKPLLFDFENGAKYFKQRGIDIDVVRMDKWFTTEDKKQLAEAVAPYETIVFDPIGEMMEKLIHSDHITGSKYRQSDGSLSMAGWGKVKDEFRNMIKWARDLNKHVLLVAHVDEKQDEDHLVKRPLIATKISDEVIAMVDIVGYQTIIQREGQDVRLIQTAPSDRAYAKDRTGTLEQYIKPEFGYIYEQIKNAQEGDSKSKDGDSDNAGAAEGKTSKADSKKDEKSEAKKDEKTPEEAKKPVDKMTRDECIAVLTEAGVDVDKKAKVGDLREAVKALG